MIGVSRRAARSSRSLWLPVALLVVGCGSDDPSASAEQGAGAAAGAPSSGGSGGGVFSVNEELTIDDAPLPYASSVLAFTPGEGAGYGESKLPDVVLGPPHGKGTGSGSLDVLSLGQGGDIVLGFAPRIIVDGPGADLVVFENAFWRGDDPSAVFAEPGEIAVSEDGATWHTFECNADGDGAGNFPGCAGWSPTLEYDAESLVPLEPEKTGGDAFDLAQVGLERAHFVRIRDVSMEGAAPSAGFDLDAVGLVSYEQR